MEQAKIKNYILDQFQPEQWLSYHKIDSAIINEPRQQERELLVHGYLEMMCHDGYLILSESKIKSKGTPYKITGRGALFRNNGGYVQELLGELEKKPVMVELTNESITVNEAESKTKIGRWAKGSGQFNAIAQTIAYIVICIQILVLSIGSIIDGQLIESIAKWLLSD